MIKVLISEIEMELSFNTMLPQIPKRGDMIGAWFNDEWFICEIDSIIYEINKTEDFEMVEINVIAK